MCVNGNKETKQCEKKENLLYNLVHVKGKLMQNIH